MKKYFLTSVLCSVLFLGCNSANKTTLKDDTTEVQKISLEDAKKEAKSFVNEVLMQGGQKAEILDVSEENKFFKIKIKIAEGREIDSYMTLDGKKFIPQLMDIADVKKQKFAQQKKAQETEQKKQEEEQKKIEEMKKNDKPKVELFVMSHCPFGTQIEKGILPVLETLGNKIDFELKFCDYAMHNKKELDEQLRQYCIQKEQNNKLLPYLKCFLEADKSEECIKEVKISKSKLDNCVNKTDKEFKVTEDFENKDTWINGRFPVFNIYKKETEKYGVKGSPSLVINETKLNSGRDADSLLKTICSGFNNPPEECKKELSSTPPSAGFGFGKAGTNTDAKCD